MTEEARAGLERSRRTTMTGRLDALLTPERLTVYPVVVIVMFLVVWGVSLRTSTVLPDYLARWSAGRLVLTDPVHLYDPAVQSDLQAHVGSERLAWFVSPPFVAVLLVPFGLLPYVPSAVVWSAFSMALLAVTARAASRMHPALAALGTRRGVLVTASAQPLLELLGAGQDTAIVLAALVLGTRGLQTARPATAGLVLSLMLVKPQLAFLVPLALVAMRAWRCLGAFAGGGVLLAGLGTGVLGARIWQDWGAAVSSPLYRDEVGAGQAWKNTTLYGLIEAIVPGSTSPVVLAAWGAALVALGILLWRFRATVLEQIADPVAALVVLVPLLTVLVTTHAMVYDLVLLFPAAVYLAATGGAPTRVALAAGYVLTFLAPILHLVAEAVPWAGPVGAPWAALVPLTLLVRWVHHLAAVMTWRAGRR